MRGRLTECLETILNKAQEPPKSKKVQHSNAKNAVLFEAISLIIHADRWVVNTFHGSGKCFPIYKFPFTASVTVLFNVEKYCAMCKRSLHIFMFKF